ncbi:diguanylate cyclase domain-containing protein [Anaplasma phagocytophilum]|uniref:diguanylate cyclase domain-containing protein n=1 Tax=Anaplasma phagocytophilum TaxID=948 RepID=UPI000533B7AA|nr:diguanylate cyclase [Anaplasma phagocytophilum]KDB57258.1 hypothetical protein P030_04490 [Anaplasma phagocytophilum str. CRT35]
MEKILVHYASLKLKEKIENPYPYLHIRHLKAQMMHNHQQNKHKKDNCLSVMLLDIEHFKQVNDS